jgi:hypothetical protein
MPSLSLRGPTHYSWGHGGPGVLQYKFSIILINTYIYIHQNVFYSHSEGQDNKKKVEER